MKTSNNFGPIVGSLLIGAAAGAALGILFAPNKGQKTRDNIVDGVTILNHDLKKKIKKDIKGFKKTTHNIEGIIEAKIKEFMLGVKQKAEEAMFNNRQEKAKTIQTDKQ